MKLSPSLLVPAIVAGCGLVNSNTFSYSYHFDPQGFMESFGAASNMTVPMGACDPSGATDTCGPLQSTLPMGSTAKLSCDATSRMCAASVDVRLAYPVNLSMQNLPAEVVQYGVDHVTI